MKKVILLSSLSLLACICVNAKKIEGSIVTKGNTKKVVFDIPKVDVATKNLDYTKAQFRLKYKDDNGENGVLKPEEAQEVKLFYNKDTIRLISVKNDFNLTLKKIYIGVFKIRNPWCCKTLYFLPNA